jgi:hypothetical protein
MDDIVIEETMTYVARELGPMYTIATTQLESANNTLANIVNPAANTLPKSGTTQVEIIRP